MSTTKQQFLSPVGRLVQGHPMEKQDKNMQGQPLMTQTGQPTQRYFCAVAFSKTQCPDFGAFYQLIANAARQGFPQLFNAQGQCTHPRFSMKVVDGDGVDDNGKPNAQKEGFAGHWVVKFQSSFPPRVFYQGRYAPQDQIQDANVLKRGYYVRVAGTVEPNGNPTKPGVYVNLGMVELVAQAPEIVSGPDAAAVFGAAPAPAMPAGAVAFPTAGGAMPGTAQAPQMPGVPAPAPVTYTATPPAMPGAQAAVPGMPQVPQMPAAPGVPQMPGGPAPLPVAPNPAFAAGPGAVPAMPGVPQMPQAPAMPAPPAPPVAPQMPAAPAGPQLTAAGQAAFPGGSYAGFLAAGWTDAALRQAGYVQ